MRAWWRRETPTLRGSVVAIKTGIQSFCEEVRHENDCITSRFVPTISVQYLDA
jgi:hypothetical protein